MAKVQGVKEKLHMPLYDAFVVKTDERFIDAMNQRDGRMIRYFVDVQNKTKLETNVQASGVLPSQNTFEARAMRVVVSGLERETNPGLANQEPDILAQLIYNSVTTLLVGEKVMIEMPTFYFPAGAGVSPGRGTATNHGAPDPMATFRFAEAVPIEPHQNFRVEMLFPQGVPGQGTTVDALANVKGPLRIWVILDGYLTRDVQ
jgi:hypothetical protein